MQLNLKNIVLFNTSKQPHPALATGRRLPSLGSRHRTGPPDPSTTDEHFPNQVFTHRVSMVAAAVAAQSRPTMHTAGANVRVTTLRSTSLPVANHHDAAAPADNDEDLLDAMVPVYREVQHRLADAHSNHTLSSASLGAAAAMHHQHQRHNGSTKVATAGGRRHLHSTGGGREYRLRNGTANF